MRGAAGKEERERAELKDRIDDRGPSPGLWPD